MPALTISPELTKFGVMLCSFCFYISLLVLFFWQDPVAMRIRAVAASGSARRTAALSARKSRSNDGFSQIMRATVERLNLLRSHHADKIANRLAQAGWRRPDSVIIYLFCKVTLPLVLATAIFIVFGFGLFELSPMMQLLASMAAILAGSYLPELYISNAVKRRSHELRKNLPDALDLLVVCTEAGLALDAALDRVAREISGNSAAMADELGHTVLELRFLPERRKALENLARRTDVPGIQALVNTLVQTERFGTPLAQSLRVLAAEMRTQRMVRAEEKAARLPAIMTVPLIIFILPALFIVLMGPAVLDLIDTFVKM